MERQKEPGCPKGWHHRQHTCGQSDIILELQVTFATAWILPVPQTQFVPRISFPHRLSLCPMSPTFSNDTPRFPATQGQTLLSSLTFLMLHIPNRIFNYKFKTIRYHLVGSQLLPLESQQVFKNTKWPVSFPPATKWGLGMKTPQGSPTTSSAVQTIFLLDWKVNTNVMSGNGSFLTQRSNLDTTMEFVCTVAQYYNM